MRSSSISLLIKAELWLSEDEFDHRQPLQIVERQIFHRSLFRE